MNDFYNGTFGVYISSGVGWTRFGFCSVEDVVICFDDSLSTRQQPVTIHPTAPHRPANSIASELLGIGLLVKSVRDTVPFALAAATLIACGGDSNSDPGLRSEPGESPGSDVLARYRGAAVSVIEDVDLFGNVVGVRQFQQPIRVDIDVVESNEGIVEQNPFRLVVESDPQTRVPEEGQMVLKSSVLAPVPDDAGPALLQFWQMNFNGEELVGQLLDTHQAESAAVANSFFSQVQVAPNLNIGVPVACIMNQGTVLQGTVNDNQVGLRIEGSGSCVGASAPKRFVIEVGAARAAQ